MIYFITFIYSVSLFYFYRFFPFISLSISALLLAAIARQKVFTERYPLRQALLNTSAVIVIAASGFYYARLMYVPVQPASDIAGETVTLKGIVRSEAVKLNSQRESFSQAVEVNWAVDKDNRPLGLRELRIISDLPMPPDRSYIIKARIPSDAYSLNPGGRNTISGHAVGIEGIEGAPGSFFGELRLRLNRFFRNNFSPESAPFLMSIITGERSLLTKEMNNAFNVTGLAHILSISGAHFGLLFFFLFKTFRFLINRIPYKALVRLTLYFTPSQVASVLCMPFMIGYLGISTTSFPAIRSFIMILLFLFGLLLQRKGFYLNTLLFAAFIIVLMQPDSILDLSFQLSFIAVLCIGIVAEKIGNKDRQGDRVKFYSAAVSHLRSSMLISIAATAGTAPLVAYYFHYFSLVSPLTNLVFTPVIGFIILPISLVSSFIFLVFGAFPLHSLIDAITRFVLESIAYVAQWKFVDVRIPAFPLILLIMFYLGILAHVLFDIRKDRQPTGNNKASQNKASGNDYLLSIVLPMSIAVVPIIFFSGSSLFGQKGIKITHLDVGQGDAAVVELPDKRTLVMDTGKSGFQVGEFLRYRGIREIEAVVISHGQFDHAGGVRYLLNNFQVNEIWDNDLLVYKAGFPNGVRHRGLNRGDITEGRGYRIAALHPYNGFYPGDSKDSDENNDSLVLEIQGRNNSFLFTGDIEKAAEENLAYLGDYLKSSVLKVPHHGSRSSASEAFFRAVSPKIAVISAGRRNMYGHPHSETIEMLGNAKILRTDRDGAIGISELPDGRLKVRTWGEFQFSEAKSLEDEVMNFKRLFWIW